MSKKQNNAHLSSSKGQYPNVARESSSHKEASSYLQGAPGEKVGSKLSAPKAQLCPRLRSGDWE